MTGADHILDASIDWQEEELESLPTQFNTRNLGPHLHVSRDKLTVRYTGAGAHDNDVGAVQANYPVPTQQIVYYYEITVKDRGQRGCIGIGFADANFKTTRSTGWEANSYGYHGDDGKVYVGYPPGEAFGPTFTTGDVVGAGVNIAAHEIFFTKNGKILGIATRDYKGVLFPTVSLHSLNEKIEVNFGQHPFVFDIEALIEEERDHRQQGVKLVSLPSSVSYGIVRSFLQHYAYEETLAAFDAASIGVQPLVTSGGDGGEQDPADSAAYRLDQRKYLRQMIREGNIDAALEKMQEWYPQILQDSKTHVSFLLNCQKFIELIKKSASEAAVEFSRTVLSTFRGCSVAEDLHLQDCLALLAYERLGDYPKAHLLTLGQREAVADAVNAAVLATASPSNTPPVSSLERVLRQLNACHHEKRALNGGQGEIFRLHGVLYGNSKQGAW